MNSSSDDSFCEHFDTTSTKQMTSILCFLRKLYITESSSSEVDGRKLLEEGNEVERGKSDNNCCVEK